jgi:hypothetical protein
MQELRDAILVIAYKNRPCSVRNIYYVGIGDLWEKDTGGRRTSYNRVCQIVGDMRERGELPWSWITDATRWVRVDDMYDSVADAVQEWTEHYRRDLWTMQPRRVEVWAESDSIVGQMQPVTRRLGVPLYSCRGQASKTFAFTAAEVWLSIGKPVTVIYVGDWDPTGLAIPRSLEERLLRYSRGEIEVEVYRLAVAAEDVRGETVGEPLQRHEVNTHDPNYDRFVETCEAEGLDPTESVEVEAVPPPVLRAWLEEEIKDCADTEQWDATLAAEESERTILARWVELAQGEAP